MINTDTTLILGAGASIPYGLPSGPKLKEIILRNLNKHIKNKDRTGIKQLHQLGDLDFSIEDLKNFHHQLYKSGRTSIDSFLEHRKDLTELGKVLIAQTLLSLEESSKLFTDEENWYQYLWNRLNTQVHKFNNNKLRIITFNYDRSFEYYLFSVLKNSFNLSDTQSSKHLNRFTVLHLYGKLGDLPFEATNQKLSIEYGEEIEDLDKLKYASESINIVHDKSNLEQFEIAEGILKESQRIYFLGFGFDPINVQRFNLTSIKNLNDKKIKATFYGITDTELKQNLGRRLYNLIEFENSNYKNIDLLRNSLLN